MSEPDTPDQVPEPTEAATAKQGALAGLISRIDEVQQSRPYLAVPVAVYKKFSDDEAGRLAALISYFAFLSIFPLLIVLATIVSRVLANHPDLASEIVTTAAGSFLAVGSNGEVQPLDLSGFALVIAVLLALWSGLAVANTMQVAVNTVYQVPKDATPNLPNRVLRSIELLVIIGVGLPIVGILQGTANQTIPGFFANALVVVGVVVLDTGLIALALRQATVATTSWKGVLPGAVIASIAWVVLQSLATWLLTSKVASAESNYGQFAVVVGLLFWFFLLAQITLYCAVLNSVLSDRLWPRSLRKNATPALEQS